MSKTRDESKYGSGHDDGLEALQPLDPRKAFGCRQSV